MTSTRWLSFLVAVLCCTGVFAQEEADEAKEKQRRRGVLIESVTSDTREFRLAENRAVLLAKIGSALWETDQKRAADLFQDAVSELIGAQAAAEAPRRPGHHNELLTGQSTRPEVLQTIAARAAEFALRSFYKTRPSAIDRAIANSAAKDAKIRSHPGADLQLAQGELQLEQTLIRMAADQNPAKAIALLKTALKNGLSGETMNLLQKLFEKDPSAANELASEVAGNLARKSFMVSRQPDYQSIQLATTILTEHIRERQPSEKVLRFEASQMSSLAEKLIAFYVERGAQYGYGLGPQIVRFAEKLAPSSVERLKQVEKNMPRYGRHHYGQDPELTKLLNHETTVEQMLAGAANVPAESRTQVYQSAANKLAGAGDFAGARNVLNEYFSGDALENAESSLNWTYSQHLVGAGRFAEAESLIDEFPDSNRLSALISLAISVYSSDEKKNKSYAVALLEKARGQMPARPETSNDMSQTMQIIGAYARIESSEAFRMFEGLLQPINELAEASVVVHGFQGSYSVRQGEMLVSQGNSIGIYFDFSIFRQLAQIDFERTLSMIEGLSRREMRVNLKQQLLEGL